MRPFSSYRLDRRYKRLPTDARAKVKEIVSRYQPETSKERGLIFNEAVEVVVRGLKCRAVCCQRLTRAERLRIM